MHGESAYHISQWDSGMTAPHSGSIKIAAEIVIGI